MRNRILAIAAAGALLTLTAVSSASAQVVTTQSRIVSDGFTTCRIDRQTAAGPFGASSQSRRICRSNVGFGGGGLGLGGFGGGGFGGGGFGGGGFGPRPGITLRIGL
jgi:hypothetical protein